MPRLQVLNGKRQGATVEVGRGDVIIGHRNTAPVCIDDPWVSWDHARLFFQNDSYWIEDLGSTNGTYVNCVRVKRERLNHEDIVFFGKTHVIFLVPELGRSAAAGGGGELDARRSDFELGVAQVAVAAEKWTQPAPARPDRKLPSGVRRMDPAASPTASAGPAIPVPPEELTDPLHMAGLEPAASDPFRNAGDPWRAGPPADSDPFASARAEAATDPFLGGPQQRVRAFADTHLDNESLTPEDSQAAKDRPGLEDFRIDDQEQGDGPALAPASAAEVSSLLDRKDSDAPLDDLDALLGDNAARTPDPGVYKIPGAPGPRRKSEALTRPFDAASAARDVAGESESATVPIPQTRRPASDPALRAKATTARPAAIPPLPPPPPPAPTTPGTNRFPPGAGSAKFPPQAPQPPTALSSARTQTLPTPQAPVPASRPRSSASHAPPPPGDESRPVAVGELAFEVAKLQDEVRRLRAVLEATRAADPEKVRVAVEGLRDIELGRQAREIADLRRQLAESRQELEQKQTELDDVTEDMIKKEDTIDALEKRLRALEGGGSRAAPAAQSLGSSGDELSF